MKNLISFLIYDDASDSYELVPSGSRVDFNDHITPMRKQVRNSVYDEIDKIKKYKIRRMPHPFKDNTQKIC